MSSVVFRIPSIDASIFDMSILAMPGIRPMVSLYPLIRPFMECRATSKAVFPAGNVKPVFSSL